MDFPSRAPGSKPALQRPQRKISGQMRRGGRAVKRVFPRGVGPRHTGTGYAFILGGRLPHPCRPGFRGGLQGGRLRGREGGRTPRGTGGAEQNRGG